MPHASYETYTLLVVNILPPLKRYFGKCPVVLHPTPPAGHYGIAWSALY
jgi:hypothetical protein